MFKRLRKFFNRSQSSIEDSIPLFQTGDDVYGRNCQQCGIGERWTRYQKEGPWLCFGCYDEKCRDTMRGWTSTKE